MNKSIEVLIYQEEKSVMQSANHNPMKWFMEFVNYEESQEQYIFNLMNWLGGKDTLKTIKITFYSLEEAVTFAEKNNFTYEVKKPLKRKIKPKSYASNFV